ncbi:hypothetical protein C798_27185 [Herbaspirillum rubrisubalbicans Os34]|uniref:Uncharacterized protein n=1 Tax=Herbaspirillum rubrisubalbicans Os34 TaxID=1235827 RepID=A0A6M3ZYQ1_9BURK|nr:hypothetical protein C798_27185 [Herbaspirillum rubrisubalbicans Os34]
MLVFCTSSLDLHSSRIRVLAGFTKCHLLQRSVFTPQKHIGPAEFLNFFSPYLLTGEIGKTMFSDKWRRTFFLISGRIGVSSLICFAKLAHNLAFEIIAVPR